MADGPRIVRERVLDADGGGDRYHLHERLGAGTTGAVFRATDAELAREVAIKVLADGAAGGGAAELVREARLAASLDHPNIVPVYDVGRTDDGRPWMAMRRIEGRTLADDIARAADGGDAPVIADRVRLAGVIVQVCNAIGSAHARGILHRDIKPANILLGAFGEVLVVDWGSASACDGRRAATGGSPWYMSPELARGEPVTTACDVYSIGATLYHALVLRGPLDAADEDAFWRRKRAGEVDAPTAEERTRVPRHLIAIALKAMRADPTQRYATVGALVDDLQAWQAGQPVSACGDTWSERARRLARRHGQRLLVATLIAASLAVAAAVTFGQRLKEYATWGSPIVVERFADDGWRQHWRVIDGDWRREGDRLVSAGEHASLLLWPHRLTGATAIDYEGEVLPGARPCDISLIWARDLDPAHPWESMRGPLKVQVGAYDGSYTVIMLPGEQHAVYHPFKPIPGRRYRIRVEIVDDRLTLSIDGARLCSYRDALPLTGGYAMLYAYYPGKAFADVRIASLGEPQLVPSTAIGDAFAAREEWDAARDAYARVADDFAGQELGEQALYRAGLCDYRAARFDAAFATWGRLPAGRLARLVEVHRLERRLAEVGGGALGEDLARVCGDDDEDVRERARVLWCRAVAAGIEIDEHHAAPWVARLVDLRQRVMPDSLSTERIYVDALFALRRYDDILASCPGQRRRCAESLWRLGRVDEALARYPDQRVSCAHILGDAARWDELARIYPDLAGWAPREWPLGVRPWIPGAEEVDGLRALFADGPATVTVEHRRDPLIALLARVHAHEPIPADVGPGRILRDRALLARGQDDAVLDGDPDRDDRTWRDAAALRAIRAVARGDSREAARWLDVSAHGIDPIDRGWREQVLAPFLRELIGERGALASASERVLVAEGDRDIGRARWRALVLLGRASDQDFLAQPLRSQADAELLMLHALHADLAGEGGARAAYEAYLRLPTWRRTVFLPDPADALARARIAALAPR